MKFEGASGATVATIGQSSRGMIRLSFSHGRVSLSSRHTDRHLI